MTPNQLRSVSGYAGVMIAPIEDGVVSASDLRHVAGFFVLAAAITIGAVSVSAIVIVPSLGGAPDIGVSVQSTPIIEASVAGTPTIKPK